MERPNIQRDVDLANANAKRELLAEIGRFTGLYEIKCKPVRLTRSSQANRYWHGVVVRSFREFMATQGQHFTHDQCHAYLRDRFIERPPLIDPNTGEVIDYMPASSARLDSTEFFNFVESVRFWMEDQFGVVVPDPPARPEEGRQPTRQQQPAPPMNMN